MQAATTGNSEFLDMGMTVYHMENNSVVMACSGDSILDECRIPAGQLSEG